MCTVGHCSDTTNVPLKKKKKAVATFNCLLLMCDFFNCKISHVMTMVWQIVLLWTRKGVLARPLWAKSMPNGHRVAQNAGKHQKTSKVSARKVTFRERENIFCDSDKARRQVCSLGSENQTASSLQLQRYHCAPKPLCCLNEHAHLIRAPFGCQTWPSEEKKKILSVHLWQVLLHRWMAIYLGTSMD